MWINGAIPNSNGKSALLEEILSRMNVCEIDCWEIGFHGQEQLLRNLKNIWLTMINSHYIGYQQEFTFLIIHICVQQTFIEFPRPAMPSTDTGEQSPCPQGARDLTLCRTHLEQSGGTHNPAGPRWLPEAGYHREGGEFPSTPVEFL